MKKNKSILMIAYYFYPCNLIGAKRTSCLANFLVQKGIDVTVIKAHNVCYGNNIDNNLLLDKRISIINIKINFDIKYLTHSIIWYYAFKKEITKLLNYSKVNLIYFSGGPFFYFSLGKYIYSKFEIHYILDFRDLWEIGIKRRLNWKGKIVRQINLYIEKKAIKNAEIITTVSEKITELYRRTFFKLKEKKIITVLNGFTEDEIPKIELQIHSNQNILKLAIFGKFSYYDNSHVKILINTLKSANFSFHLYIIGKIEKHFFDLVSISAIKNSCTFMGYMNYSNAMITLSKMDCLLLNNRIKIGLGTKIFDYIYLNKPIVAFVKKDSESTSFLRNFKNSFIVNNENDFTKAINEIYNNNIEYLDENYDRNKYSRKSQMEDFFEIIQKRFI